MRVYRNEGGFDFVLHTSYPGRLGRSAVGDIDGDGDLDICSASSIHRNVGGGQFMAEPGFQLSFLNLHTPQLLDHDGDGDLDLLFFEGGAWLFVNDGTGQFGSAPANTLPGGLPNVRSAALLDAERDGDVDLAVFVGSSLFSELRLWRNDGLGGFVEEAPILPLAFNVPSYLGSVDFNGDDFLDLVVVLGLPAQVTIHLNDGTGQFTLAPWSGLPNSLAFEQSGSWGDWDQDGDPDFLGSAGYWRHDSLLEFDFVPWPPHREGVPGFPGQPVHAADVDGDLDIDLLINGSRPRFVANTALGPVHTESTRVSQPLGPHRVLQAAELDDPVRHTAVLSNGDALRLTTDVRMAHPTRLDRTFVQVPFPVGDVADVTDATMFVHTTYLSSYASTLTVFVCAPSGPKVFARRADIMRGTLLQGVGQPSHIAHGDLLGGSVMELVLGDPTVAGPRIAVADTSFGEVFHLEPAIPLPAPTFVASPAFESVIVEDMNGDGALDIVHEFRVIESDGAGGWQQVADFALLVPPASTALLTIDYDGDGDRDLVAYGPQSPLTLLRNDGASFVDATFGWIPTIEIGPAEQVTVGDVDSDGDEDLLVAHDDGSNPATSNLLRNDGGSFSRILSVGPPGALVATDRDGREDLLTADRLFRNVHSNLHAPRLATPGSNWLLEVRSWRAGPLASLAVIAISTNVTVSTLPGIGEIYFDPASADYLTVPLLQGRGERSVSIPLSTQALGIELVAQGVVLDLERMVLTAPVFDIVR